MIAPLKAADRDVGFEIVFHEASHAVDAQIAEVLKREGKRQKVKVPDDLWHAVKNTPRVTGFVGTGQQPTPLSEEEVQHIVYRVSDSKDKPKLKVKFEKNETVRITEGPFASFTGVVDEVNEDRETLKVKIDAFVAEHDLQEVYVELCEQYNI